MTATRALLACIALVGCDDIFDLEAVSLPGDAPLADMRTSPEGLVAWYTMDTVGSGVVPDALGDHDGTCRVKCPTPVSGVVDGALEFDTTNAVVVQSTPALQTMSAFTIAVWARLHSSVGGCMFSKIFGPTYNNSWQLCPDASQRLIVYFYTDSGQGMMGPTITLEAWTHYALRFDGSSLAIYIDGLFQTSTPTTAPAFDSGDLVIGGDYDSGNLVAGWPGPVDDARIYNRALSPGEIAELAGL